MKMIFLGAPGAGKGTQAAVVGDKLGIPTISTGNLLRAAVEAGTQAGLQAKQHMDSGGLVPDDIVVAILKDRIAQSDCVDGFILDGFPRTIPQAQTLDALGVAIDLAISIEVPDEEIKARLSGRRVCLKCGATYHVDNAPSPAGGNCGKCGEPLVQREDDRPEAIEKRLVVFHEQTEPLKAFYDDKGKLSLIHGTGIDETTVLIMTAVDNARA